MSATVFSSRLSSAVAEPLSLWLLQQELCERDRSVYAGYRIIRIVHYKEKTAIGHEFLVLHLTNGLEEITVRIERRPSTRKVATSSKVMTDDSITPVHPDFQPENYFLISKTVAAFTVMEMCIICTAIRKAAPVYDLLREGRHCYWFCAAFMYWVRHTRHTIFREGKDYEKRGRFRGIKVITDKSFRKSFPVAGLPPYRWIFTGEMSGHTEWVTNVRFTPDGQRLLSCSGDRTLRLWDVASMREVRQPLEGHTECVESVAVSPDGRRIVSGARDGTVRIWDLEVGVPVTEPSRGHTDWVYSIAFSPDGCKFASGSKDKSVRIWDMETGAAIGEPLLGHADEVFSVAWSPDGSRIASGSHDKTVRLWDAHTGTPVGEPLRGHVGVIFAIAFSPDSRHIASGSGSGDNTIRIWDASSGRPVCDPLRGHTSLIRSVTFSPDGSWIASGAEDKTVYIWDSQGGGADGVVARLNTPSRPFSVAWSPTEDRIAVACANSNILIWSNDMS